MRKFKVLDPAPEQALDPEKALDSELALEGPGSLDHMRKIKVLDLALESGIGSDSGYNHYCIWLVIIKTWFIIST
jgi:hypothetical protein